MTDKTCGRCGLVKQADQFSRNKSAPDGRHSVCKACRKETAAEYRRRPDVAVREAERLRVQYQENKPELLARRRARYAANKEGTLAQNRAWREQNLERHRALCRKWAKDNPDVARMLTAARRARIKGAPGRVLARDVRELMVEQLGRCKACGCDLAVSGHHVDHIHPLSKGGANDRSNVQLLCPTCNRQKGAKLPSEWRPARGS